MSMLLLKIEIKVWRWSRKVKGGFLWELKLVGWGGMRQEASLEAFGAIWLFQSPISVILLKINFNLKKGRTEGNDLK